MNIRWISGAARRILQPFQSSLRNKLMLIMVVVAVLPLSMVTLFATRTTKSSLSEEVVRTNKVRMEWAAQYFNEKFDQINGVAYSLMLDKTLFPEASGVLPRKTFLDGDELNNYAIDKITPLYTANNKHITSISLYLKNEDRLFIADKEASRSTTDYLNASVDWAHIDQWPQPYNGFINENNGSFTFVRSMNRFENRQVLGGVSITARWNMMDNLLDMIHSETESETYVVDAEGNVLYNPYSGVPTVDKEMLRQALAGKTDQGNLQWKKGFLFYSPAASGKLWLVKFIPAEYVTRGASSTLNFSVFTAIAFILVAIAASIATAYFTTKPIIRLTRSMKAVEIQKFDIGLNEPRGDEIGTLERRFNSMLAKIRELIEIEYKAQIKTRTAQVKAMQAQINPHFLHNALQSIGGLALSRDVPEINEHVRAISDLFRYAIRMKNNLVTVADEMEHVNNYLQIQKLRFRNTINVRIDVDPSCLDGRIPKFSLQPIVENCFVHGLEGKMGQWTIGIRVEKLLDEIEISVSDNGSGISEDDLRDIRERLDKEAFEDEQKESMGLYNVHARIKLLLGEEYGLFVTGNPDGGTTVKLLIPAEQKALEGDLE